MKKIKKEMTEKEIFEQNLVQEIKLDFKRRQEERKVFEAQWQLNMDFFMGNQYCNINKNFEIEEMEQRFYWQEHQVYNHITPLIERRLTKLQLVRPKMNVFPTSNDDKDVKTAKISKKIIDSIYNTTDMTSLINEATTWSEICGTSFYKVVWNSNSGDVIAKYENGNPLKSGDVELSVVSPFEIFPESSTDISLDKTRSLIHARAYHIEEIKNKWGIDVEGENLNVFSLDKMTLNFGGVSKINKTTRKNYAIVIERYDLPSIKFPNGRLVIIAGDKLVYFGELPYINNVNGTRGFPFVQQVAFAQPGCFWGVSVIERLIPLQRAYNAIKNRKHEFINRLTMGVLTVEDGSMDLELLEEEGLYPGKILVYRQGSSQPKYMENDKMPFDFSAEEKTILKEFSTISGISDISTDSYLNKNLSGSAIELLIEQDENRMLITADNIRFAIKLVAKHILRLYKQFVNIPKLTKIVGDNGELEIFYFKASDISSDDIVFETKNEITDNFSQRRTMLFDLINQGLLSDENGKMSTKMKLKILEMLGYGIWETASDINELHTKKATKENYNLINNNAIKVLEIDNHELHISEHIAFMLGEEFEKFVAKNPDLENKILEHIKIHKEYIKNNN